MLVDFIQKQNLIEISYIDDNHNIAIKDILLKDGYYNYVKAEDFEESIPNLRSFYGHKIKKEPAKRFRNHNINEFINYDLKINYPEFFDEINKLRLPKPFSVDIEVLPTDENGYSHQTEALNPITSISITDDKLNSLQFIVKNENKPTIDESDNVIIRKYVQDILGKDFDKNLNIRVFETEREMLMTFLETIRKYFTSIIGWNFIGYDWTYIDNRCKRIGLDVKLASPKNKTKIKKIKPNRKNKSLDVSWSVNFPTHRIIADYMQMFKDSLIYNNLGSYSLDNISNTILHTGKVSYDGNLRTLYETNFLKFLAYGFVDTILVMMLHHKTKLYDVDFFESYMNKIPYLMISQNGISNALIYNQLREENRFLLTEEFNDYPKQHYPGGYVKLPIKKVINAVIGCDYSALYPNTMLTYGITPERYVDSIRINEQTKQPLNENELQKWLRYKNQNCILTPTGRIYAKNNDKNIEEYGLYLKIEKRKQDERAIFKKVKQNIYLNVLDKIEEKLKEI